VVTDFERDQNLHNLATKLEERAKLIRLAANAGNKMIVDWEVIRQDIDESFEYVLDMLGVVDQDDDELDVIDGEETDPEDDSWFEGFDDV